MNAVAHFLVGPTASGKSSVASHIAKKLNYSILSADSMNLYCGMDIGTAKPDPQEKQAVQYYGIDLVEPTQNFSVANYLQAIKPAFNAEKPLIIAGGTGLYIKCLIEGFDESPAENNALRTELESLTLGDLQQQARQLSEDIYHQLTDDDRQNRRRLTRVIERAQKGPSPHRSWGQRPSPPIVGLRFERSLLHQRIAQRVEKMYADGLLDEAQQLLPLHLSKTAQQAIGYAEVFAVLQGTMSEDEAKEKTIIRTRQLAKRQMTWFRNQLNVQWVDVSCERSVEQVAQAVIALWEKDGATPVLI